MDIITGDFPIFANLRLFGEGGDGGAGAAPGPDAGQSAEPGVQAPDAGEHRRLTKAERRARIEKQLQAEQAQKPPPKSSADPQPAEPVKQPFDEIEKLYHDEIGGKIQKAVTERVKNLKDSEAELNALKERSARQEALLGRLTKKYNLKAGEDGRLDLDAAEKAVDDDDELYEAGAVEHGWSTDTEKYVSGLERKAEELKNLREQQAKEAERQRQDFLQRQQFERRLAETEAAKKLYPNIDLIAEMQDRTFASLMNNPLITVQQAYEVVHRDEIRAAEAARVQDATTQRMASSIRAGAARPTEGGLGRQAAVNPDHVLDPRNLTKAERRQLKERARRGEEIIF